MSNRYMINWDEYAACARAAAAEGAVLLRNERETLPLRKGDRVSVFGRIQFHYYKSGTGSGGLVNTRYTVGILDALKEEKDIQLNAELEKTYTEWLQEHPFDEGKGWGQEPWSQEEMPVSEELIQAAAAESDVALVVIGRTAGEDRDASVEKGSYLLMDTEADLIRKVSRAFPRTAVLLNTGNIIDMNWLEDGPAAALYVWQGGMEGGHAVADLLMGRVTPSGKLTDTIARSVQDHASDWHFGSAEKDVYAEDIYVGYRWFETFAQDKVAYPFGFGLSYTTFRTECLSAAREDETSAIEMRVENTGKYAGKEVVQIYARLPQGTLGQPARVLVDFKKTRLLRPGDGQTLRFRIPDEKLAAYDDSGCSGYPECEVLEAGEYALLAGTDVQTAKEVIAFQRAETRAVRKLTEAAKPTEPFRRLRPALDGQGQATPDWEDVPLRSAPPRKKQPAEIWQGPAYTGDRGIRFGDVADGKASLEDFIAQLTDEDLCCMVRGEGMSSPKVTPGTAAAFGGVTERLAAFGIPCGCCTDGPSGIRMDTGHYAFSLPSGTCLASSWNEEGIETLFQFLGAELRRNRIDTILGPGMNLHRHPLNGRNFEYFSEDPLLTGRIGAAQLRGLHSYGVTGTIKHFIANNQEFHRRELNSVVSERALREIYLKGFEIAVKEAGAHAVMTTYGAVNGIWTGGHEDLVTTILREQWGFDGMVMSDWWATMNDEGEKPTLQNTAAMVRAQNDVFMVVQDAGANSMGDNLAEALEDGRLTRAHLARSAANILKFLLRSPVTARSLNRVDPEEAEAWAQGTEEDRPDESIPIAEMTDSILLCENLAPGKGEILTYGVRVAQPGTYTLSMRVRIEALELAQLHVAVMINGALRGVWNFTGADREERLTELDLGPLRGNPHYLRLRFGGRGIIGRELTLSLREPTSEKMK